jgi:toxin ParE1/3/4
MKYKLTLKAEDDILYIYSEGELLFGIDQATEYHTKMERVLEFLSENPNAARERNEINPPVRVHPYGSHIIIYMRVSSKQILVLRVRHKREDWASAPV